MAEDPENACVLIIGTCGVSFVFGRPALCCLIAVCGVTGSIRPRHNAVAWLT